MAEYYTQLALEYFQTRPRAERTPAFLAVICRHLEQTYCLPRGAYEVLVEDALREAVQRQLCAPYRSAWPPASRQRQGERETLTGGDMGEKGGQTLDNPSTAHQNRCGSHQR